MPKEVDWEVLYEGLPDFTRSLQEEKGSLKNRWLSLQGLDLLKETIPSGDLSDLMIESGGKPYLNQQPFHFNIAHSGNCIGVVVSESGPVGLDVEKLRKNRSVIHDRVFSVREKEFLNLSNSLDVDFTKLWTRKEAVVKLLGVGISIGLSQFSVLEDELFFEGKNIRLEALEIPNHFGHVAYEI